MAMHATVKQSGMGTGMVAGTGEGPWGDAGDTRKARRREETRAVYDDAEMCARAYGPEPEFMLPGGPVAWGVGRG